MEVLSRSGLKSVTIRIAASLRIVSAAPQLSPGGAVRRTLPALNVEASVL